LRSSRFFSHSVLLEGRGRAGRSLKSRRHRRPPSSLQHLPSPLDRRPTKDTHRSGLRCEGGFYHRITRLSGRLWGRWLTDSNALQGGPSSKTLTDHVSADGGRAG